MLTHGDIWRGIDRLAENAGISVSALARRAGLDSTAFNKSKRTSPGGKPRWPSTESLARVLDVAGISFVEFAGLVGRSSDGALIRRIPIIGYAQAGLEGYFDYGGFPVGSGWDEVVIPDLSDEHAYALEIAGDSMSPVYRDGDIVVVSPAEQVRRGDRVVVKRQSGEVMAKQLLRQTANRLELMSVNSLHPDLVVAKEDVVWMHRIVWVTQ